MIAVMLGLTVTMNNALYETTQQVNTKATVATVGNVVCTDLNNAGGKNIAAGQAFISASATGFKMRADTSDDTSTYPVYTVEYTTSFNGADSLYTLSRRDNGGAPLTVSKNLTSISFTYFHQKDDHTYVPIADPNSHLSDIDRIRVKLVAKVAGVTQGFTTALNDISVNPPNI